MDKATIEIKIVLGKLAAAAKNNAEYLESLNTAVKLISAARDRIINEMEGRD